MSTELAPQAVGELGTLSRWRAGLEALHARIAHRFRRGEVRKRAQRYLAGLLGRVGRKNGWQLAEHLGEPGPQGVQRLLNAARWDAEAVRDDLRGYGVEHLGDPQGVLVLDETGFLKKGTHSVGVPRQYSGTAGRTENCQIEVFVAYATARERAFLDRALYLPKSWATDEARRAAAGVPGTTRFATKGALAKTLLARAFTAGVPAAWVVADTVYGADGRLRQWLEAERRSDVLAVPWSHHIRVGARPAPARAVIARLPAEAWSSLAAGEGSQGPRWYAWAWLPLPYASAAGRVHWLLARRSLSDPTELAYYRVYAPVATALPEAVRAAGSRWAIEVGFEQAKGKVGLDQYEVRGWTAWHRHITLALLAHALLEVTRLAATQRGDYATT
jgi:SRSO17 transposase